MRLPILLSVTLAGAAKVDPCWFVGWRFAKTYSFCESSICYGIAHVIRDDTIRPVAIAGSDEARKLNCDEAEAFTAEALSLIPVGEQTSDIDRGKFLEELNESLENGLVLDARRLFFGATAPLPRKAFQVMAWADFNLLRLLKLTNEADWMELTNGLRSSAGYRKMLLTSAQINSWSLTAPNSLDVIPGHFGPLAHFIVDMIALIETPVTWPGKDGYVALTLLAGCGEHAHRKPYRQEFLRKWMVFHEQGIAIQTSFAELIDYVSELDMSELRNLVHMVTTIDNRPSHEVMAAEAIIRHQLSTKGCRELLQRMPEIIAVLRGQKKIVTLLDFCRNSVTEDELIRASRLLSLSCNCKAMECLAEALPGFDVGPLAKMESIPQPDRRSNISSMMRHCLEVHQPLKKGIFKTHRDFDSYNAFQHSMQMLGRCIGFAVLQGEPIAKVLRMRRVLATTLYNRLDEQVLAADRGVAELRQITSLVYEPVHFVRIGIQDIVGPLGVKVFSEIRWTRTMIEIGIPTVMRIRAGL